jgi:hypothetical protein
MKVVHLGCLKAPRKAAGQMDLLTVPSADGVDSKVIHIDEALSASSRDRYTLPFRYLKGRLEPARPSSRRQWRHAELASRPVQRAALDI